MIQTRIVNEIINNRAYYRKVFSRVPGAEDEEFKDLEIDLFIAVSDKVGSFEEKDLVHYIHGTYRNMLAQFVKDKVSRSRVISDFCEKKYVEPDELEKKDIADAIMIFAGKLDQEKRELFLEKCDRLKYGRDLADSATREKYSDRYHRVKMHRVFESFKEFYKKHYT